MGNNSLIKIEPVVRKGCKLRALVYGPTFSGKTALAFMFSKVFTGDMKKVVMLDTEGGRGKYFANSKVGLISIEQYLYGEIPPKFDISKFNVALAEAERIPGVEFIIIDGLSALWSGPGGLLEHKIDLDKSSNNPNMMSSWDVIGKMLNEFIIMKLLRSPKHIICTARAKNDWAMVPDANGKIAPSLMGLGPEIRKTVPYEFDFVFEVQPRTHEVMVVKDSSQLLPLDRSILFDEKSIIAIRDWLQLGTASTDFVMDENSSSTVRRCPDCNSAMVLQREEDVIGVTVQIFHCKGCKALKRIKK